MVKRLISPALILIAVFIAGAPADGQDAVIVVSGAYRGRIDGCDCPGGLTGGLARRAQLLHDLFPDRIPLGLDCGGILDLDPEGGLAKSRCAIFGLAKQGLKIMGVAPRDLFYGVKFLKSRADSAGITAVSANLIDARKGEPLFKPWVAVSVGDARLAVTSLVNYQAGRRYTAPIGWTRCPPDSVLDDLLAAIPDTVDFIILLTDMGVEPLRRILDSHPVFDLVVSSSRRFSRTSSLLIGETFIVRPAPDGRALNHVVLHRDAATEFFTHSLPGELAKDPSTALWLQDCLGR